jgi:hypothetical protein
MLRLLDTEQDLAVMSGFLYLPLLLDPTIAAELQPASPPQDLEDAPAPAQGPAVVEIGGRHFVRAVTLHSLVDSYPKIHPEAYQRLRTSSLEQRAAAPEPGGAPDARLRSILLEVMAHFIRKPTGLQRKRLGEHELLELLGQRVTVPESYSEQARSFLCGQPLRARLDHLEKAGGTVELPRDGAMPAAELRRWFHRALEMELVNEERDRVRRELQERRHFTDMDERSVALLLYLGDKGALEVDGSGFRRSPAAGEYLVYVRTGEYALKDYYGRLYLFPDCRVAVSTAGLLRPIVLEKYKHPFLFSYDAEQEICLRRFEPPTAFTAENAIKVLEEGISALFYGYDSRRRNGYHSLDRITPNWRTVDFDDLRVPKEHPKIVSGTVQVKNDFR